MAVIARFAQPSKTVGPTLHCDTIKKKDEPEFHHYPA